MKNHYANYFRGIPNFKDSRVKLVSLNTLADILAVLDEIETIYEKVEI